MLVSHSLRTMCLNSVASFCRRKKTHL